MKTYKCTLCGEVFTVADGEEPKAAFAILEGDEVEAVYAYCNLHSLWKA